MSTQPLHVIVALAMTCCQGHSTKGALLWWVLAEAYLQVSSESIVVATVI